MADVRISLADYVHLKIDADRSVLMDLAERFVFDVPGAKFMPKFKAGMWDGKIRLLNAWNGLLYAGLIDSLIEECKRLEYTYEIDEEFPQPSKEYKNLFAYIKSLDLKFIPRDYQIKAFVQSLDRTRSTVLSPTGSGKSLIIYLLTKWVEQIGGKVLIIVPTIQLVHQMESDFADYEEKLEKKLDCQKIAEGATKKISKNVVISTWQSIYKQPKLWYNQFSAVIGDEVHTFKATSLVSIMEKCIDVPYRWGFTGTLDKAEANELVIRGLFGPIIRTKTTKQLIESGELEQLDIRVLILKYQKEDCKLFRKGKFDYANEVKNIILNRKRCKLICKLALDKLKGNTFIMFRMIDHGKMLFEELQKLAPDDLPIYYVDGGTKAEERERIRNAVNEHERSITVSSTVFSTGTNVVNLNNIILAGPNKALIKLMQTIGRVLRRSSNASKAIIIDVADDLRIGKYTNFTFRHLLERLKIYDSEKLDYKTTTISI